MAQYKLSVAGGTFDHFHAGHAAFLRAVLTKSDQVLLGITSDAYVQAHKSKTGIVEPYIKRKEGVLSFLKHENAVERVRIEPIDSGLLPKKFADLPVEAIIVTDDTLAGAHAVNEERETQHLPALAVVVIGLLKNTTGRKISSTDIRAGTVDSTGNLYLPKHFLETDFVLPKSERHWFQEPFGELFTDIAALPKDPPEQLATVGDAVTQSANAKGFEQKISVIDYVIERSETHQTARDIGFDGEEMKLHAINPAGHITSDLSSSLLQATELLSQEKRILLEVDGEEDLAVIPLVLMLPLGYVILYGQPGQGIVRLVITPQTKQQARDLLEKFSKT